MHLVNSLQYIFHGKIIDMKKIFLLLCLCFFTSCQPCFSINFAEYSNKPYVGMAYTEALEQELPLLLIFAEPDNIIFLARLMPLVNMVYNEYKGQYNFCIINTSIKENKELTDFFAPKNLPALYLIDTKNRTYTFINKKYYNKSALRKILTKFKNGTLFD